MKHTYDLCMHGSRREQDHEFLASRVNRNINHIFGILTSRAIEWCINESILRGSGGGGLQNFTGPFSLNINIFLES